MEEDEDNMGRSPVKSTLAEAIQDSRQRDCAAQLLEKALSIVDSSSGSWDSDEHDTSD